MAGEREFGTRMSLGWWRAVRGWLLGVAVLAGPVQAVVAAPWFPLGPYGGDARSIAADPRDPKHLYLGTAIGWVYESHDGGVKWERLAQISRRNDLVIDHILVDAQNPKRLMVGAWIIDHPDGGLFISEDSGRTWYSQAQMSGQSIRAMGRSQSNPQEIVAGTLKGVFRSMDNGVHWTQVSPEGSTEIHEVESIAIDPTDGNVIYAGTWHLPWKTTDGGAHWENIKQGIIDDSDVFSIIVDPQSPKTVFASACSGIYKSEDAGAQFRKVQGIPSSARRTRKLTQDTENPRTVFAGTTEGLYRTLDSGEKWERMTGGDVIVNDVFVDPKNSQHVLLATDRGGIYRSEDGGSMFEPSNSGFSSRQVVAYAASPQNPSEVYVGVVNDKATGGVFVSHNGGVTWTQVSDGLGGRDVFSLLRTEDGTMLAGTAHGVFRMNDGQWMESAKVVTPTGAPAKTEEASRHGKPQAGAPAELAATKPAAPGETLAVEPVKAEIVPQGSASAHAPPTKAVARKGARRTSAHAAHGGKAPLRRTGRRTAPQKRSMRMLADTGRAGWLQPVIWALPAQHARPRPVAKKTAKPVAKKAGAPTTTKLDAVVYALEPMGSQILAGTSTGLFRSDDGGMSWLKLTELAMPDARFVGVHGKTVFVGTLRRLAISMDAGSTWDTVALPKDLTQIGAVSVDELGNLWVGGREGVYYSTDLGENWKNLRNLFLTQVDNIYFDAPAHRMLVTSMNSTFAFAVSVPEYKVSYWDTGWNLRFARPVGDHLIGATLFDGIVVQPQMVDSAFSDKR